MIWHGQLSRRRHFGFSTPTYTYRANLKCVCQTWLILNRIIDHSSFLFDQVSHFHDSIFVSFRHYFDMMHKHIFISSQSHEYPPPLDNRNVYVLSSHILRTTVVSIICARLFLLYYIQEVVCHSVSYDRTQKLSINVAYLYHSRKWEMNSEPNSLSKSELSQSALRTYHTGFSEEFINLPGGKVH